MDNQTNEIKRGRGRPRKTDSEKVQKSKTFVMVNGALVERGRGRPKKDEVLYNADGSLFKVLVEAENNSQNEQLEDVVEVKDENSQVSGKNGTVVKLIGLEQLEGVETTGLLLGKSNGKYVVEFKGTDEVPFTRQFDVRTLVDVEGNPNHKWRLVLPENQPSVGE